MPRFHAQARKYENDAFSPQALNWREFISEVALGICSTKSRIVEKDATSSTYTANPMPTSCRVVSNSLYGNHINLNTGAAQRIPPVASPVALLAPVSCSHALSVTAPTIKIPLARNKLAPEYPSDWSTSFGKTRRKMLVCQARLTTTHRARTICRISIRQDSLIRPRYDASAQ
jgi:hypothetical protein